MMVAEIHMNKIRYKGPCLEVTKAGSLRTDSSTYGPGNVPSDFLAQDGLCAGGRALALGQPPAQGRPGISAPPGSMVPKPLGSPLLGDCPFTKTQVALCVKTLAESLPLRSPRSQRP